MELRQYFTVIWRWLWLIVLGTFLAGSTAGAFSLRTPRVYEAKAGVVVVKSGYSFAFEPKIKTLSDEELSAYQQYLSYNARRTALAAMVKNGAIAARVIETLGSELSPEEQNVGAILGMVRGQTIGGATTGTNRVEGDLIEIAVWASEPQKAARIANAWAEAYEKYVNEIYGGDVPGSKDTIEKETTNAKADYENAEAALIRFVADNQIDELNRQIQEKQQIIASLQSGKQAAVTTLIDTELEARSKIIAEYINTQANNRLVAFTKEQQGKSAMLAAYMDAELNNRLTAIQKDQEARSKLFTQYVEAEVNNRLAAFQKEQEAKSALFNAYVNADITTQTTVFNKQVEAKVQALANSYAAKLKLEQLLEDSQALKEQIGQGRATDSSATSGLAILLLKAEAFASSAGLPGDLHLQLDTTTGLAASPDEQVRDLEALINVLEDRVEKLETSIEVQSRELFNNEGYQFLTASRPEDNPLTRAIHQKYEELFGVGELAKAADTVPPESELSQAIMTRYDELFGVGELAKVAESTPFTTTLFASIQAKYPDLFEIGELSALTEGVSSDNPLAVVSTEKSQELLQLKDLEDLPAYTAAEPLTRAIDKLENEIDQLQAQLEQESATKQELTRARDLAWETYSILARKVSEVSVASAVTGTEVRFAIPAVEPRFPMSRKTMQNTVLAGMVGLMLTVGVAFLIEYLRIEPSTVPEGLQRSV